MKILLLIFLLLGFCNAQQKSNNFEILTDGLPHASTKNYRIAIKVLIQDLLYEKAEEHDIPLAFNSNPKKSIDDFMNNKIAYLTLNTMHYIKNIDKMQKNVKDMYTFLRKKNSYSRYFLVVRDKHIKSIKALKNSTIAMQTNEYASQLYLNHTLLEKRLPLSNKFFSKIKEFDSTSRVLMKLFFKKVDACIIPEETWDLMVEMNPKIAKKLKIISKSKKIFFTVLSLISKNIDDDLYKAYALRSKIIASHTKPKAMLALMKYEDYKEINQSFINPMLEYYKEYITMKNR